MPDGESRKYKFIWKFSVSGLNSRSVRYFILVHFGSFLHETKSWRVICGSGLIRLKLIRTNLTYVFNSNVLSKSMKKEVRNLKNCKANYLISLGRTVQLGRLLRRLKQFYGIQSRILRSNNWSWQVWKTTSMTQVNYRYLKFLKVTWPPFHRYALKCIFNRYTVNYWPQRISASWWRSFDIYPIMFSFDLLWKMFLKLLLFWESWKNMNLRVVPNHWESAVVH